MNIYIYIYIYMSWVQVTPIVTLNNVTPSNNLLMNLYFENSTAGFFICSKHACQFSYQSDVIYYSIHKLIFYALF